MTEPKKKKVVRSTVDAPTPSDPNAQWTATPEARSKALTKRIIAGVLWLVAIVLQAFAIFGLLNTPARTGIANQFGWSTGITQDAAGNPTSSFPGWAFWWIIGILAVNLTLCLIAGFLWKSANRLDPAKKEDKVRFFVQNQLGAIIPIIAFLPLIILIFLNKDMDGKQKGIAGSIGIVALLIAAIFGVDFNPPSVEQYTAEQNWDRARVVAITGDDLVYWVETGTVYHLCAEVSPLQSGSTAEFIHSGTVSQATADTAGGMERLTKQVQMEINQCNAAGHDFSLPDPRYLEFEPQLDLIGEAPAVEDESPADEDEEESE